MAKCKHEGCEENREPHRGYCRPHLRVTIELQHRNYKRTHAEKSKKDFSSDPYSTELTTPFPEWFDNPSLLPKKPPGR